MKVFFKNGGFAEDNLNFDKKYLIEKEEDTNNTIEYKFSEGIFEDTSFVLSSVHTGGEETNIYVIRLDRFGNQSLILGETVFEIELRKEEFIQINTL